IYLHLYIQKNCKTSNVKKGHYYMSKKIRFYVATALIVASILVVTFMLAAPSIGAHAAPPAKASNRLPHSLADCHPLLKGRGWRIAYYGGYVGNNVYYTPPCNGSYSYVHNPS